MLTGSLDREISQWTGDGAGTLVATIDCRPVKLKYTETSGKAAVGCADGTARIVDLATGQAKIFR